MAERVVPSHSREEAAADLDVRVAEHADVTATMLRPGVRFMAGGAPEQARGSSAGAAPPPAVTSDAVSARRASPRPPRIQ